MSVERTPRVHGWTTVFELHCPRGHHIKQDSIILEHGAIRCKHKTQPTNRPGERGLECGAWLYVLGSIGWNVHLDALGREQITIGDDVYVAEVTYKELDTIRTTRLNASQTLAFLGIKRMTPADGLRRT